MLSALMSLITVSTPDWTITLCMAVSREQIAQLIEKGQFEEVTKDGQEISK
jgi:hypothetical protein